MTGEGEEGARGTSDCFDPIILLPVNTEGPLAIPHGEIQIGTVKK